MIDGSEESVQRIGVRSANWVLSFLDVFGYYASTRNLFARNLCWPCFRGIDRSGLRLPEWRRYSAAHRRDMPTVTRDRNMSLAGQEQRCWLFLLGALHCARMDLRSQPEVKDIAKIEHLGGRYHVFGSFTNVGPQWGTPHPPLHARLEVQKIEYAEPPVFPNIC